MTKEKILAAFVMTGSISNNAIGPDP